ncbi:selenoprotein S [Neolamprologus brichardi]|uniref:selenoprotein S n=1 Tax=Neolamprologus brichardi TaxID=32507 RepID=UPI001643F9B4|nr:selenoprotein S [Neolamprologus brichardi]
MARMSVDKNDREGFNSGLTQRQFHGKRTAVDEMRIVKEEENPTLVERREEAVAAARMKMQEELDAKASIFREKQKLQEEERRRQKIEMWESMQQGKSYKGATKLSQVLFHLKHLCLCCSVEGCVLKSFSLKCGCYDTRSFNKLFRQFHWEVVVWIVVTVAPSVDLFAVSGLPFFFACFTDYNPLTGQGGGGSCSWRPGRRGPSSGG